MVLLSIPLVKDDPNLQSDTEKKRERRAGTKRKYSMLDDDLLNSSKVGEVTATDDTSGSGETIDKKSVEKNPKTLKKRKKSSNKGTAKKDKTTNSSSEDSESISEDYLAEKYLKTGDLRQRINQLKLNAGINSTTSS